MGILLNLTAGIKATNDSGRFRLTIQVNSLRIVKKLSLSTLLPGHLNCFRLSEAVPPKGGLTDVIPLLAGAGSQK
jgi:hypothetical protein